MVCALGVRGLASGWHLRRSLAGDRVVQEGGRDTFGGRSVRIALPASWPMVVLALALGHSPLRSG